MNDLINNEAKDCNIQLDNSKEIISHKEIIPFADQSLTTAKEIISILLKKPSLRKKTENDSIISYLSSIDFESAFEDQLFTLDYVKKNLYSLFINEIQAFQYNNGNQIYKIGDLVENIYIVLQGKVTLFKYSSNKINYTPIEYYSYLKTAMMASMSEESKSLLQKTIEVNKGIYPIREIEDLAVIEEIIFICKVVALCSEKDGYNKIKAYYDQENHQYTKYDFIKVELGTWVLPQFKFKLIILMNKQELFYLKHFDNNQYKKTHLVTLLEAIQFKEINQQEIFGNYTIVNENYNQIRENNAKVNSASDSDSNGKCILCVVNKKAFYKNINRERRIKIEKDIDLLYSTHFINSASKNKFVQHIYPLFKLKQLKKGFCLFEQKSLIENCYIITEGTISLSITTSLVGLNELITDLISKLNQNNNNNNTIEDEILSPPMQTIKHVLEKKREFALLISEKEFFGLWEYWKDIPEWCYTATIKSERVYYYELPLNHFEVIKKIRTFQVQPLYDDSNTIMQLLIERMIQMKKAYYDKINSDYNLKLKQLNQAFPFSKKEKSNKPNFIFEKNNKIWNISQLNKSKNSSFEFLHHHHHHQYHKVSLNKSMSSSTIAIKKKNIVMNNLSSSSISVGDKSTKDKKKNKAVNVSKPKINYKNVFSPKAKSHRLKLFYLPKLNTAKDNLEIYQISIPYLKQQLLLQYQYQYQSQSQSFNIIKNKSSLRVMQNVPLQKRTQHSSKWQSQLQSKEKSPTCINRQNSVTVMMSKNEI